MDEQIIQWDKYFDHIFCIVYVNNGRYKKLCDELDRVGILKSGIFEFMYDCDYKYKKEMYEGIYAPWGGAPYQKPCTIQHVKIWNICKKLGYERVLIMEDDNAFLKDLNEVRKILDNTNFTDITMFHYNCGGKEIYYSSSCYACNQHGIDVLLDNFNNNEFCISDQLFMQSTYAGVTHIRDDHFDDDVKITSFHKIINSHINDYKLSIVYPMICQQHFQTNIKIDENTVITEFNEYNFWIEKNDKVE